MSRHTAQKKEDGDRWPQRLAARGARLAKKSPPPYPTTLRVGTYNIMNFHRDTDRIDRLARSIVADMKSPHILGLQEVQEDDFAPNGPYNQPEQAGGDTSADENLQALIEAIVRHGGPRYHFADIDPNDNKDGGRHAANIRQVFLYDPARVELRDTTKGTPDQSVDLIKGEDGKLHLSMNPGRIHPEYSCFAGCSKPLAAEFIDKLTGETIFMINVHLVSKRMGYDDRDLTERTKRREKKRASQASVIAAFADSLMEQLHANGEKRNLIIAGDFNSEEHEAPVKRLSSKPYLNNLAQGLEDGSYYTYVYQGEHRAYDFIFASIDLASQENTARALPINAGKPHHSNASDHNPVVAEFAVGNNNPKKQSISR